MLLNLGGLCPPGYTSQQPETDMTGSGQWPLASVKLPNARQCTEQVPTNRNYGAQNDNGAEAEKPDLKETVIKIS